VILFTLPHSPLAQPWSVIGGLLLPALVGLACGSWLPAGWLAPAVAVAVSIWVMGWLRCIHPPGGAMALVMAVAAGQGVAPGISLAAVGWNTVAILVAAMAVNNLIPGRRYPLCSPPPATPQRARQSPVGVQEPDLAAALAEIDAYLDISADDLSHLFRRAAHHAFRRHVLLTCGEVMEPALPSLEFATSLNEPGTDAPPRPPGAAGGGPRRAGDRAAGAGGFSASRGGGQGPAGRRAGPPSAAPDAGQPFGQAGGGRPDHADAAARAAACPQRRQHRRRRRGAGPGRPGRAAGGG
jgi:hypothetical protein